MNHGCTGSVVTFGELSSSVSWLSSSDNHVVAAAVVESYCHMINFPEHEREQQRPRG